MTKMVTCESCGFDTDYNKSDTCACCGAKLVKRDDTKFERLVAPSWGVLSVSFFLKEDDISKDFAGFFVNIWNIVQEQQLATLLPSQDILLTKGTNFVELVCHSGVASKIEFELRQAGFEDVAKLIFNEISDNVLEERIRHL